MFKLLMSILFVSTNAKINFDIPDNVDFITSIYNTSNCSNPPYKNVTLKHLCYETKKINDYPKCCYELLNSINIFTNKSLNSCVSTNMLNSDILAIKYDCNLTHFKNFSTIETFSYIGIISTAIILIILMGLIMYCCCGFCRIKKHKINYIGL